MNIKEGTIFTTPTCEDFTSGYEIHLERMHNGIDIANSAGKPIVASQHGLVSFTGWNGGYGYTVTILHANGLNICYASYKLHSIENNFRHSLKKGQFT